MGGSASHILIGLFVGYDKGFCKDLDNMRRVVGNDCKAGDKGEERYVARFVVLSQFCPDPQE